LAHVIDAWPKLSKPNRAAILALVEAAIAETTGEEQ
jgi:hypothetical protein